MTDYNLGLTYLLIGICFGALGAILVRANGGMHLDTLSIAGVISMNIGIILWGFSLRHLDLTYAAFIWYAVDAVILVFAGVFLFKEDIHQSLTEALFCYMKLHVAISCFPRSLV